MYIGIKSFIVQLLTRLLPYRALLIDLFLLGIALITIDSFWSDPPVPWLARATAIVAALFLLPNVQPTPSTTKPSRAFLRRLTGQLSTCAVTAIVWIFFFGLPPRSLAFAALWVGVSPMLHWIAPRIGIGWGAKLRPKLSYRGFREFLVRALHTGYRTIVNGLTALRNVLLTRRVDVVLVESILVALLILGGNGLSPGLWPALLPPVAIALWFAAGVFLGPAGLAPTYRFLTTLASFLIGIVVGAISIAPESLALRLVSVVWIGTALAIYRWRLGIVQNSTTSYDGPVAENLRWGSLVVAAAILLHPFLIASVHGTGDALWYATMLADMMAQIRAGEFPVFIGQSIYQFNGSIYPLRVAPAFHHAGALVDLLTGYTLGPVAALNTLIFGVGLLALAFAYQSLRALLPANRWVACSLSVLYLSCPGTLGLAFNTDLYMSWMTVPWLPLVLYGTIKSFSDIGYRPRLALAGGLGLLWWGHTPIALWSTVLAAMIQAIRLVRDRRHFVAELRPLLGALALFTTLVAYPVGSVLLYPPEPGVDAAGFQAAFAGTIVHFLDEVQPAIWLPLSFNGRALSDFQFGYALWFALAAGLWAGCRFRSATILAPVLAATTLAILLTAPFNLSHVLWSCVPEFVRNTTGNWVMNRLYFIQSGFIVFGLAAAVAAWNRTGRRLPAALSAVLAAGVVWSAIEAGKFSHGSSLRQRPPESGATATLPENVQITRFAYLVFPKLPAYFTHGVTDPGLEQRLFRASDGTLLSDNFAAAAEGTPLGPIEFTPEAGLLGKVLISATPLRLVPGRNYVMVFDYAAEPRGVLQIKGSTTLREYALPEYGEAASFGYGNQHSRRLAVSNHTRVPQDIELRYFFDTPVPTPPPPSPFARVRWIEYEPKSLPVEVTAWIPYRARVRTAEPAWLETPRMYQTNYVAQVDGRPAQVRKSSEGLVSVAVPKGESAVELRYKPPLGLQTLYWASLLTLLGVVAAQLSGHFWPNKNA